MPFDLLITRCASMEAAEQPGGPACGISEAELVELVEGARAKPGPDPGVYWVPYPQTDEAWFALSRVVPKGSEDAWLTVSLSYGSPRYLRNLGDALDQALRIADDLGARVFVEGGDPRPLTAANIDRRWAPGGKAVKGEAEVWRHAWEGVDTRGGTPLEWPVGPIDRAPDIVVFDVPLPEAAPIGEALRGVPGVKVSDEGPGVYGVADPDGNPLCVVTRMDTGVVRVRGVFGRARFRVMAPRCAAIAELLARPMGAVVGYEWHPWTPTYAADWAAHAAGAEAAEHWRWMGLPGVSGAPPPVPPPR